ncbi:MAG TPA: AAA family ATPase, partial [Solirubrobacteraceae bacterium]
ERVDAHLAERARREAQTMGRLAAHPNLVTVYDAGDEGGQPYIVEEYVDGKTLAAVIKEAAGAPLELGRVLGIALDVCAALDQVHRCGIVHRDLKPDNVWLTADGTAKLGDFGLLAAVRELNSRTMAKLTDHGVMVGTVPYMPPEQALGQPVDERADLYALGAMLYEMVTGSPPFAGDDALAIISQHLRTPPVAPSWHNPDVPAPLNDLILALLAKDARDRPPSAAAARATLEAIAAAPRGGGVASGTRHNPLEGLARGVYVGREAELDELCAALDLAVGGRGQMVFVAGEPGIGKSRLAEQLTTYAQVRGATVLWGRCYEGEGAPPYWPWMQIIRSYADGHDPELLSALMGVGAADIAQMVSEIRGRLPNLPEAPALEPEQARFRLFDSVTRFLVNAACQEPLFLVIDDLHCADRSSLMLLEFLAYGLRDAPLLVVGTYRDAEVHPGHPLGRTLGELARICAPRRISLTGLTREQIGRYVQMTAGVEPDDALVAAVHEKSEGNPFFVSEMVRLLSTRGRLDPGEIAIPGEVREVIDGRLARLSETAREVLTAAALIGRTFHMRVVQEAVGLAPDRLLEALDEAVAASVISERASGRYRFAHVLICDTLAERLPTARRVGLHHRIALAGEAVYRERLDPYFNMLAHHFLEAAPVGGLEKGLHYATAAAEQASARLAHEEAARLYERALRAAELGLVGDERRCELLLRLGEAHTQAGAVEKARVAFSQAAELARRLPAPGSLARAALGFGGPRPSFGVVDDELIELLEEALAEVGSDDAVLRTRLLARLAMELYFTDGDERRLALVEQAVGKARGLGDPATLAYALNARHDALWGPQNAEERLAIADEVIQLALDAGDCELESEGHHRRAVTLLEIGDAAAAREAIAAHARLAEELRRPYGRWQAMAWRATDALLAGRLEEGARRAQEAFALGERVRASDAAHAFAIQMLVSAIGRGGWAELMSMFEELAERYPATRWRDAGLPFVYAEVGRRAEAAEAFEAVARAGFAALPRDLQWLVSITALADCCAYLGDAPRAQEIYELMEPYAGRIVVMPDGWACFGSADRALGVLASTMRQWERAEKHFEVALGLDMTMGARAWQARTELGYARMLAARGRPGDVESARMLADSARATARELGMEQLAEQLERELVPA